MKKEMLKPVISEFSWFETTAAKVNKYSCVSIDTNSYSVPEEYVGKIVTIKKALIISMFTIMIRALHIIQSCSPNMIGKLI